MINLQGIQILDNSRRDRIVHHIDYEDVLYVMGKENELQIGFIYNHQLADHLCCSDSRLALYVGDSRGYEARVIAEDIIAYAQLRLAEMTKNDQIEFVNSSHVNNLFDQLDQDNKNKKSWNDKPLDTTDGEDGEGGRDASKNLGNHQGGARGSFKGLQELHISHADLLDSQDLDHNETFNSVIGGLGQARVGEKNKDLTTAERHKKGIVSQLGNCLKFKSEQFFAYSKRYALYTNFQQHE